MNTKTLLAFLQALPASTDADLTNDSAIKQLGNKVQLLNPSEMRPNDWGKIQTQIQSLLETEKYAALNQAYQTARAKLETLDITANLLPTPAELKAVQPANRQIGTLGYHPGPDSQSENDEESENYEIINLAIIILNDDKPATTSQSLLQRLNAFLKDSPIT
ncbi:MAG TPA: hypothetical protein EYP59_01635 [Thiotrichaceae bacterium]|nr:hypothetical protein [Thiotrichaceae bacterium]